MCLGGLTSRACRITTERVERERVERPGPSRATRWLLGAAQRCCLAAASAATTSYFNSASVSASADFNEQSLKLEFKVVDLLAPYRREGKRGLFGGELELSLVLFCSPLTQHKQATADKPLAARAKKHTADKQKSVAALAAQLGDGLSARRYTLLLVGAPLRQAILIVRQSSVKRPVLIINGEFCIDSSAVQKPGMEHKRLKESTVELNPHKGMREWSKGRSVVVGFPGVHSPIRQ
ncbi:hypothetical protein GW17_00018629 [Ensete ventricosum]|nr:hypothetical protein GW17_00018629 [Ensete ventricosum]